MRRKWRTFIPREGGSDSLVELLLDADFCAGAGGTSSPVQKSCGVLDESCTLSGPQLPLMK